MPLRILALALLAAAPAQLAAQGSGKSLEAEARKAQADLERIVKQMQTDPYSAMPNATLPSGKTVSAKQLKRSNLPERLVAIAHEFDIAPHQMEVELTESVAMQDSEQHVTKLHALRDLGVRVSVDDFGTGYSSLAYLRNLPIDYLKIDRTFVRDMNVDRNDAAIVRAIISMAQSLHLGIVAEGIETREHASQLLALGCSIGQGYFFSKPMPASDTNELLRTMRGAAPMTTGPSLEIVRVS